MAAQIVLSAQTVGDAFARQYYAILQHSPELVHRFYKDMSKIDRFDSDIESMLSTTTMKAIDEKIQSYGSLKADVKFVDAQESYNEGVIVLVIGSMVNEDDSRRNFIQTFFLAPQDNGYYVLNDIFRYVDDDDPDSNEQDGDISPVTSNLEPPPIEENHDSEQLNGEVYYPSELPVEVVKEQFQVEEKFEEKEPVPELPVEVVKEEFQVEEIFEEKEPVPELPVEVVKEEFQVEEKFEEKEPVPEVVEETPQQSWVVVESSAKVEGTSKKSYASIVMKDAPSTMSLSTPPKSVSKIQNHQVPVLPATKSVAVPQSSNTETVEDVDNQNLEGGVHSIYVRNLPMNIPVSVVEEVFQEFGPIRSNGIQILHHRAPFRPWQYTTSCFGFVEFETAVAALSAIEASPIYIEGHRVGVEEKKSTAKRAYSNDGNSPGRYPPGERGGSGLLSEGDRGHGGYEEGRGYGGRGDSNKSEFGGRRGVYEEGRGYGERGDGNKSEFGGRRGGYDEGRGYGGRGDGNKSEFGGRRGGYGGGRGDGGRGDGNKSEFGGRHGGYEGGRGYGGRGDSNKSEFGGRRGGGRGNHTRSEGYQKSDQTGNKSGRMNCGVESSHTSTRPRPRPQRVSA